MDRTQRDACTILHQGIQNNVDGNKHISVLEFFRKPAHSFDEKAYDDVQILSGARLLPSLFCNIAVDQILNFRSFQLVKNKF
jgi:hypothetical protein